MRTGVSRRKALATGVGIGLAWTGTKYGRAWLRTGSVRCAGLVPPLSDRFRFEYGTVDGLEMAVGDDPVSPEELLTFRLRNRTDETRTTGFENQYALQQRTSDGWQHLLKISEDQAWPALASPVTHEPGEGFTWTFPLTEDGLTKDPYHFCGPLTPGTYRFGYWGISDEWAIPAVRFDIRG